MDGAPFEETNMLLDTRKVGRFIIKTYALPEDLAPRVDFDDNGETADAISRGEHDWFVAKVVAEWNDFVLATDYLGGCCYKTFEDFANGQDYHADMVDNVVHEATKKMQRLANEAIAHLDEVKV